MSQRRSIPAHALAAGVLTVSVVGDGMIYAVIPATAAEFGLGAVGLSVVLSINRFVRIALNPAIARWLARTGLRRGAVVGALLAAATTATYVVAQGLVVFALSRAAWGVAFSILRMATLGYATMDMRHAPGRLGSAAGIHAVAPSLMLVIGPAFVGAIGARPLFAALAAFTLLAVPLALALPVATSRAGRHPLPKPPSGEPTTDRPAGPQLVPAAFATAVVAFGVDGLITAGTVLALIASGVPTVEAATLGGIVLAARKVAQVVLSPVAGSAAQRWRTGPVVTVGMLGTAAGLALVAAGAILIGALLAVAASSVALTLTPAAVAVGSTRERLHGLARIATARDIGSAGGAAMAPIALVGEPAAVWMVWLYLAAAAVVLVATVVWLCGGPRARVVSLMPPDDERDPRTSGRTEPAIGTVQARRLPPPDRLP